LDWLAQLVTHIPNRGEQMVRYYGYYSNKCRGMRKKAGTDEAVPALVECPLSPKEFRRNWARLIQKVYQVDPLICPKCTGSMRIISFIEDLGVVEKILKNAGYGRRGIMIHRTGHPAISRSRFTMMPVRSCLLATIGSSSREGHGGPARVAACKFRRKTAGFGEVACQAPIGSRSSRW